MGGWEFAHDKGLGVHGLGQDDKLVLRTYYWQSVGDHGALRRLHRPLKTKADYALEILTKVPDF